MSRWRNVTAQVGARNMGSPLLSKPSSTCALASHGIISEAGASRSSLPCSTNCIAAAPVIALVIEKIAPTVSVVIATPVPIVRSPAAPSHKTPLRSTTIATAPGAAPASMPAARTLSRFVLMAIPLIL